jgi:hypothetical protein
LAACHASRRTIRAGQPPLQEARAEFYAAREALGVVKIQSVADASALLEWLRPEVKHGDIQPWEIAALNNASKFLSKAVA